MSAEDVLARLRAGLDADERIARAAAGRAAEWRSDGKGVEGGPFTPADPEWGILEAGEHTIVYDEGWPLAAEALHIAAFDPARVLGQVEAIRKLIAERDDMVVVDDYERGYVEGLSRALEILASIYPDPTEES
ncbi:DUF6221 family protein [Nocardia sp. NPDC050712]|uniref:DUF6221 family protein n=1 Tax=Nocardia sp. NPDC050712 TaxID=3155518 RepID=UPI0033C39836